MRFPFLSRAHHDDVVSELRRQIAEKQKLLDQLFAYVGLTPQQSITVAEDESPEEAVQNIADPFLQAVRSRRPSAIVRSAQAKLDRRFSEKINGASMPDVLDELNAAEQQGRAQARH